MSELALAEGTLIAARYRLEQHLGEGGMGTVWSAVHTVTRRGVAMKFLKESVRHRKDLRERFLREAATASSLKHPNVVEIIDVFDFAEGSPVMVMELLKGETLGSKLLRDERLSLEETAALLLPVSSAVGTAHAHGIVHRDLKPENLFLAESEGAGGGNTVKVLDFGIAKLTAERYLEGGPSALLTESGALLGTPCYMAPEQASGDQPLDHRADVWSLGVILYECLSGSRPIEGESLPQVVARLMSAGIMPLERIAPELPGDVTALVKQMLTREVGRRTPSLLEVSRVLARYTNVAVPEFGAPIMRGSSSPAITPKTLESARPKAKVVTSRDADPQGPTMLSSPPVNSSLHHTPPPPRRSNTVYVAAAAVLLIALGGWVWGAMRSPGRAETLPAELPTLQDAALAKAAEQPVVEPSSSASPVASGQAAAAISQPGSARPKPRPRPTPVAAKPVQQPAASDETLFSGRK